MKVLKIFLSFSIGTWIGAIIGVITIPLLTHFFSPADFGKASMFALALNMMMLFTLFGIDQAFIRFFYEEETDKLLSKCLILTSGVYLVINAFLFLFRREISIYLFDEYVPEMILLLGLTTIINVLNSYAVSIVRMEQKGFLYSMIQIGLRLFELVFIVLFLLFMKKDYTIMVYAKSVTLLVVTLYAMFITKKTWAGVGFNHKDSKHSLSEIFYFSYPLAITNVIAWALQSIDKLALKEAATITDLGIYTAAFRIVLVLQIVQTSFTTYWIPLSYERFHKYGEEETNKTFFSKVSQGATLVMLSGGVLLIMCKGMFGWIVGKQFQAGVSLIPFLVFMPVMYTLTETTTIGLNFYKKVKVIMVISLITLLVAVAGNYLLVPIYKGKGAAISIAVSSILFFILRTQFSIKYFAVDYKLSKVYMLLALMFGYAWYSTFFDWNIFNTIIGVGLLGLIVIFYFKNILHDLKPLIFKSQAPEK
ncbi:lipopolysaccharide biosynthesis protein [Chitinophaga sp. Hz27]|uniref:lipopolysaccharide biosynthesis protein n=1 Tax=Chitinophaga sp. Hz27 TaxID=3347169 RepID=UPI0035DF2639